MKLAQLLTAVILFPVVSPSSSDRPPPASHRKSGGSAGPSGVPAQALMHLEVEPKSARRSREVHRLPPHSFAEAGASRAETRIIGGVNVWLEALYADWIGPPPVQEEGKPIVLPPEGISKSKWFEAAWSGKWAWVLWEEIDQDLSGFMSRDEITSRWSSNAMPLEFGSPQSSPHIADYNGYLECMAYTVLLFRKWDVDKNGALDVEELGNSTVWKKRLLTIETFNEWAAGESVLEPFGFMALLWNNFAEDTPLAGLSDSSLLSEKWDRTTNTTPSPPGDDASAAGEPPRGDGVLAAGEDPEEQSQAPSGVVITEDNFEFEVSLWLEAIHSLIDTSGNTKIEADEWYSATLQGQWADVLWQKLDSDGNGQIQKHEFEQGMPAAMLAEFGGAPPASGHALNAHFSYVVLSILIFRRLDADRDGHLKWEEFQKGKLVKSTDYHEQPECGHAYLERFGVITQAGFNMIASQNSSPTLELEELVRLLAMLFSPPVKRR